jgi:hypothetical protein
VRQQRERVPRTVPFQRLLIEGKHVEPRILPADLRDDVARIVCRGGRREVAAPERHVEVRVLAAGKAGDAERAERLCHQRKQHDGPALGVACEHRQRLCAEADADVALPGIDEIEALIGCCGLAALQRTPFALDGAVVFENLDAGDLPDRRCQGARGLVSDHSGHCHR